jgi:hypothetical protein
VFVRGLRGGISILCLFERIALGYLVLIVQPKQQQPYFQTMQTTDYSKYEYGNVTMRVHLVSLKVFVFDVCHLFNDGVGLGNMVRKSFGIS